MTTKLNTFKATIASLLLTEGVVDSGCEDLNKIQAIALELGGTGFDSQEGACTVEITGPENAQQFIEFLDEEDCVDAYDVTMDGDSMDDDADILELPEETVFGFAIYLDGDSVQYEAVEVDGDETPEDEDDEDAKKQSELEESATLIDRLETFVGGELKDGRMTIKGFPVDVDGGNGDGDGVEMDAVDADAAKGLAAALKKAGFKVKRVGKVGMLVESYEAVLAESRVAPYVVDDYGMMETLSEVRKRIQVNSKGRKRIKMQCAKGFKYDPAAKTCMKIAGGELAVRRKANIKALVSRKAGGAALKNRAQIKTKKAMKFRAAMGLK